MKTSNAFPQSAQVYSKSGMMAVYRSAAGVAPRLT